VNVRDARALVAVGKTQGRRSGLSEVLDVFTAGVAKRALARCVGQLGPARRCSLQQLRPQRASFFFLVPLTRPTTVPSGIRTASSNDSRAALRQPRAGDAARLGWALRPVGAQRRHHSQASPQFVAHLSCSKARWYPNRGKPARAVLFYGYLRPRAWPPRQNK
jgi:hypothetical protein